MERVKSIDGSSPADFLHFGGLKMRFCRDPKPAVSWTPSILQLIFSILEARKFDFCRVVKPRVHTTKFYAFWHTENLILTIRENNISRYLAMSGNFLDF